MMITKNLVLLAVAVAVAAYLAVVRRRRFERTRNLARKLGYEGLSRDEIYKKITLRDAETINSDLAQLEFPRINNVALQFALFRTYAIPTISAILKKTRQLCEPENAGRRYADTVVLIAEFVQWPLDSERASLAIARMNYLHSLHPQILPRDTLYTLLLFATQPPEFFSRFEWRSLTELELAARWKYWYEVGLRMQIPAATLPTSYEAMETAYRAYEAEYMVPADSNNYVGLQTVDLLLYWVPTSAGKWFGRQIVFALLDERLRLSMKFPKPQPWVYPLVNAIISIRRFCMLHLALPRSDSNRVRTVCDNADPKTGRHFVKKYDNEPWYAEQTIWNQWGPWAIISWTCGLPQVGQEGYGETGYEIESVGPVKYQNVGREKVRKDAMEIRKMGDSKCPFA